MTENQTWLARRYLLYRIFSNMWFFGVVWLYFYRLYISDQQVGLLDGIAFAIGLIAEVPSGALADKFGRDKMVRFGQLGVAAGIIIQILGHSFTPFVLGQAIMMIGLSLISGADDALFFEKLGFTEGSKQWRKLVTRGSQIGLTATLAANLVGARLHVINPRIPWALTSLAFVIASLLIWPVKDARPKSGRGTFGQEVKSYLQDAQAGFAQFRSPKLRPYVPFIVTVQGLFYLTGYGLLRMILLSRFTFTPVGGAIAVVACGMATVLLLHFVHTYAEKLSEKWTLLAVAFSAVASLLLATRHVGQGWGFVVVLLLYAGEYVLYTFMSEILNNRASERQRATVLSVASFLRMLPYVCLAPLIGWLNTKGKLQYFLIIWALLIAAATVQYFVTKRGDTTVEISATPETEAIL